MSARDVCDLLFSANPTVPYVALQITHLVRSGDPTIAADGYGGGLYLSNVREKIRDGL